MHCALHHLDLQTLDLLTTENIGNQETPRVRCRRSCSRNGLSITEGEDNLPRTIAQIHPRTRVVPVGARAGEGLPEWFSWFQALVGALHADDEGQTSTINSISTGAPSGSSATPTADLVCAPASPKISPSKLDAPLMIWG